MPSVNDTAAKAIYTACTAVAVSLTAFRLALRWRARNLWWDDHLVAASAVFNIMMCAGGWMHWLATRFTSRVTRIAAYYVLSEGFYFSIWTARLSILFSIIRIFPTHRLKKYMHWLAVLFCVVMVFLGSQLFWVCGGNTKHWEDTPEPQCPLTLQVVLCQLIADLVADILLMIVPVQLLRKSVLEKGQKLRMVCIFSATILISVVSIVHAVLLVQNPGKNVPLVAVSFEVSVSVFVANLSVLATAIAHMLSPKREKEYGAGETDRMPVIRMPGMSRGTEFRGTTWNGNETNTFGLETFKGAQEVHTKADGGP